MVTIKDVAREAGVAISTVSNVFNNGDIVSEETKQKVLEAVEKLHYIPNMNAKLLKSNRKNTIGLFVTSLQGDFYNVLTQAIHLQCKLNNYMLNIYVSNDNSPDEIYRMIIASGVAGAIIYHEDLTGDYVKRIATVNIPMVFMTYANVVFSYGTERFIRKAAEIGMDGLILPDVPFEEKEEFDVVCKQYGLDLISLIAPTSHERIAMIAKEAEGFVYCVSSLGVTGMRTSITTDIGAMVKLVKAQKDIPCAVGFGISTPEQAKKMADQSDGAIVGSAIVKLCGAYGKDCVPKVKAYVKEMKDAIR